VTVLGQPARGIRGGRSTADKRRRARAEWARTPVRFTPVKNELLVRLLIADLVGEQPTRESVVALRDDLDDLELRLDEAAVSAATLPHRTKYLLLTISYLRRLLALQREFVDELERELDASE
jgi:hypothetical protein